MPRTLIMALVAPLLLVSHLAQHARAAEAPPPPRAQTQAEKDADAAFHAGNTLQEAGKMKEALAKYQEGLKLTPNDNDLLWNAGVVAQGSGDTDFALECWNKLKAGEPGNWRVLAKLVQGYQAKGQTVERDAARKLLVDLYSSGKNPELAKQKFYCREQFSAGTEKIMVIEYFELSGAQAMRYAFLILNDQGSSKYKISLGSYEATNEMMKEMGSVKPGDRGFHLDGYFDDAHKTYAMYNSEPTYEDVRKTVVDILTGKTHEMSSTHYGK